MKVRNVAQTFRKAVEAVGFQPTPSIDNVRLLNVVLEDLGAMPAEQAAQRSALHAKVIEVLPSLAPKQKNLLSNVFGLDGCEKVSLVKIAQNTSVHSSLISYYKTQAVEALREKIWGARPRQELQAGIDLLSRVQTPDAVNYMTDLQLERALKNIGEAGPEAAMAAGGLATRLYVAVFDLPSQQLEVFKRLYAFDTLGMPSRTVRETANVLETDQITISHVKRDALANLRKIVTGEYDVQEDLPPPHVSLDSGMNRKDNVDVCLRENKPDGEEALMKRRFVACVNDAMNSLSENHRRAMNGRFNNDLTLKEIGDTMNVGKERVRQLEAEAFYKIRHVVNLKGL